MGNAKKIFMLIIALIMVCGFVSCRTSNEAADTSITEPSAAPSTQTSESVSSNSSIETNDKTLIIYSPATDAQVNAVVPLFEEKYGIKCEVITGGTGELLARVAAEGDNPYADVIFGGGESSYAEYKDIFQDYVSSEDKNLIPEYRNTLGYCTNFNLDSSIFIVNTDLVGDIEINGYMDLLNPALKGKIACADPTASSSAMMHIETILSDFGGLSLDNEEGWGVISKLLENLDGKLASGSGAAWKSVADGEMVVALTYEEAGITLEKDGAPIRIVYPEEGTVFTPSTAGIVANCKHFENAKLFIDFILSYEVQNMLCNDLDNRPVRDDVEYPAYFKPATDVKTVEFDQRFVNEHKEEITNKYMDIYMDVYPR